jgi:sterile alpha motif and leucine zipper containing kinase AZK
MDCNFFSTEYIVDLMGAPGTLIPSDISGNQFQDSNDTQLNSDAIEESVAEFCLALEQINRDGVEGRLFYHSSDFKLTTSQLEDLSPTQNSFKQNVLSKNGQFSVPEVVDSQFAQNLHELLLKGGALLPTDLLSGQGNFHGNKENA